MISSGTYRSYAYYNIIVFSHFSEYQFKLVFFLIRKKLLWFRLMNVNMGYGLFSSINNLMINHSCQYWVWWRWIDRVNSLMANPGLVLTQIGRRCRGYINSDNDGTADKIYSQINHISGDHREQYSNRSGIICLTEGWFQILLANLYISFCSL